MVAAPLSTLLYALGVVFLGPLLNPSYHPDRSPTTLDQTKAYAVPFEYLRDAFTWAQLIGRSLTEVADNTSPDVVDLRRDIGAVSHLRAILHYPPDPYEAMSEATINLYATDDIIVSQCVVETYRSRAATRTEFLNVSLYLEEVAGPAADKRTSDANPFDGMDESMTMIWETEDGYDVVLSREGQELTWIVMRQEVALALGRNFKICG